MSDQENHEDESGELRRLHKKRKGTRVALMKLVEKTTELMNQAWNEDIEGKMSASINVINSKFGGIKELDISIQELIDTDEIEKEIEDSFLYELEVENKRVNIENYFRRKISAAESTASSNGSTNSTNASRGIKLPKISIKKFNGDPTLWQQFNDTFNATIHQNVNISAVEKFTYLKSYLEGPAAQCLQGFSLSAESYDEAYKLLKERFGNNQLVISSHVTKILNLPNIGGRYQVTELRNVYDQISSHVRSLMVLGIDSENYGPVMIPIILSKLPSDICLVISRKAGNQEWKIDHVLNILKEEISARESCNFLKQQVDNNSNNNSMNNKSNKSRTLDSFNVSGSKLICAFCGQNHYHDKCNIVSDISARKNIVKEKNLCYNCLSSQHLKRECNRRAHKCYTCKSFSHHSALCTGGLNKKRVEQAADENKESAANLVNAKATVLLQTATVSISNGSKSCFVKALFDPGAQQTYLTQRVVDELNIEAVGNQNMIIRTFGANSQKMSLKEYAFDVSAVNGSFCRKLRGYGVPKVCSALDGQFIQFVRDNYEEVKDLELAEKGDGAGEIDLLIGADHYWEFVESESRRISKDGLMVIKSKVGWLLSGPVDAEESKAKVVSFVASHVMEVGISNEMGDVERFWNLDSLGICCDEQSVYDKNIEKIKFVNGRYEVQLPFKENLPMLEDNYEISLKRLKRLKIKLDDNADLRKEYNDVMTSQLSEGIIEKVQDDGKVGNVRYLPHQSVVREDKSSTKVRVVYDASAKKTGPSLNECLHKGPCITPLLYDMLLCFRIHKIVITADIEKAYLQIGVAKEQRDFMRLLWYDNIFKEMPQIEKFRFTRLIFGASCSQFLLNAVIQKHISNYQLMDPEFVEKVSRKFYVDDLNVGTSSIAEGFNIYKKLKSRFLEAKFNLRKWRTNSFELRCKFYEDINCDVTSSILHHSAREPVVNKFEKILGIEWNELTDVFIFNFEKLIKEATSYDVTKRNILRVLAAIYDPLGFLQIITVKFKLLFQKVCLLGVSWDEILDENISKEWLALVDELRINNKIVIPRCYFIADINDPVTRVELHAFADSSEVLYGSCLYLKFITVSGRIFISFVTAKSRLVPGKKKITIPRLELLACLISSRLVVSFLKAASKEIVIDKIFCWSDSQIALSWIKSVNKEFKVFIENRVNEIRKNIDLSCWYYCNTLENPADLLTRSNKINLLIENKLWWNGPSFLANNSYGKFEDIMTDQTTEDYFIEELMHNTSVYACVNDEQVSLENVIALKKYSCFLKLLQVTAYVLRFIANIKRLRKGEEQNLCAYVTADELYEAKLLWLLNNQAYLQSEKKFDEIKVTLDLQRDDSGLYRSYSRFAHASNFDFNSRSPIILSRQHYLTELIIWYCHNKVLHHGVKQTLAELRCEYWITCGRSHVRKLLNSCVICKRYNARSFVYPTKSDMPSYRFSEAPAFYATGIDYMGPLFCLPVYGNSQEVYKSYIVIYTCASTRAIILDAVHNASSKAFIASLSRFIARRGCPSLVVTDNGSVFKSTDTQNYAGQHFIKWKFNLDAAPWWGGMWERLVGSVKRCLKKVIGSHRITYVELQTLITEVESIINNRPVCDVYDEEFEEPITPNHLLFGRRLENVSVSSEVESHHVVSQKSVRKLTHVINHFWNRWKKEYLSSIRMLQQKNSNYSKVPNVKTDDLVLINDDHQPRQFWKMGRVTKILNSRDDKVRGVELKVGKTGQHIRRPVNRLSR